MASFTFFVEGITIFFSFSVISSTSCARFSPSHFYLVVYSRFHFACVLIARIILVVASYALMFSIAIFSVRFGLLIKFLLSSEHFSPFIICSRSLSSLLVPNSHLSAFVYSLTKYSSIVSSFCSNEVNSKRSTHLFGF